MDRDEANTDHIPRHGVRPREAEEALTDPLRLVLKTRSQREEERWDGRGPGPLPGFHPQAGQGAGHHPPGRHPRGEKAVPEKGEVDEGKAQGTKPGGDPRVWERGGGGGG